MSDPVPSKLSQSWLLFTTSIQVVRQNKKLLLFSLVTSVCYLVMMLFFFAPALLYPSGHSLSEIVHWERLGTQLGLDFDRGSLGIRPNAIFYGYAAVVYLVTMFLATFFNAALYNEILKALAGDPVSVRAGLAFAWSRVRSILIWSLFAGAVGLVIKALEKRFGWIGQWVMRFVGLVWSVASVFAIPVLIREGGTNPLAMLRRSAAVLRKTWGESLAGYVGITIGSWIILVGSLVFMVGIILAAAGLNSPLIAFVGVLLWFSALLILGYVASVAGHVYRCALYIYATEGVIPAPYNPALMDAAWKIKKV